MMNFLPEEDKIKIKKEYLRRLFMIWGIFFFLAVSAGIVLLLPAFLFLRGQEDGLERQLIVFGERISRSGVKDIVPLAEDLNGKISVLASGQGAVKKESDVVKNILEGKTKGIKINNLSFNGKIFSIKGISENRTDLLVFVASLKNNKGFKQVESPVSNLVKEKNIEFTINISL